jgi:N-acetylglucosaminyldiphosphoundecaprenol N-acetyl-beta-D-mannosaminyltransferase
MTSSYVQVQLFGLTLFGDTKEVFMELFKEKVLSPRSPKPFVIFTPNPEQVVLAEHSPEFREQLQCADVLIPDGAGIVTASRLRGVAPFILERIPGVEVVKEFLAADYAASLRTLVIGGRDYGQKRLENGWQIQDVSEMTTVQIKERKNEKVIFWVPGYKDVAHPTKLEKEHIDQVLKLLEPHLVFVALGAPAQEQFVIHHFDALHDSKVKVAMVVGGAFDFLSGKVKRAPALMQQFGFEWLYRLIQEPWRWRRQLRLVEFIWLTTRMLVRSY